MRKHLVCICGTRPEVIKFASIIHALKDSDWAEVTLLSTGQHREMLDQELRHFGLTPDRDLNLMQPNQKLSQLTSKLIGAIDETLSEIPADMILAQGDTSTTLAAAMVSFFNRIPLGYIESGLRSGDITHPFPEEMNRILICRLATLNFAATERCKRNLLNEGIDEKTIHITGNTAIDPLLEEAAKQVPLRIPVDPEKKWILVTAHRRENFGEPMAGICEGIRRLADADETVQFIFPVHKNPNASEVVYRTLSNHPRIMLTDPLDYDQQIALMKSCYMVITDSGGIQEEAPSLGVPVLVLRDNTDRQEGVDAGVAAIIGTRAESVFQGAWKILQDHEAWKHMARKTTLYGDGHAAEHIVSILENWFQKEERKHGKQGL